MTTRVRVAILSILITIGMSGCVLNSNEPSAVSVAKEFVTFDLDDGFYFYMDKRIDMEFSGCSIKRRSQQEWLYLKPSQKYPDRDWVDEFVTCEHLNSVINPLAAKHDFGYEDIELSFPAYKIGAEIILPTDEILIKIKEGYSIQDVTDRCKCVAQAVPTEGAERQYKIKLARTSKMNPLKRARELYWMEPVEWASLNFLRLMPR